MLAANTISEALGGPKVLGKKLTSNLDVVEIVQQGLPSKAVFYLQKTLGLPDDEYSATLGVSSKWLVRQRKTPKSHLGVDVSDRLFRVARLYTLAEEVLENQDAALRWLHRPQPGLNEQVPLELMRTEVGAKEVEELLYRIEYGMYS